MKTFKQHIVEEVPANAVGTADKASVAGEPIKKAGIVRIRRNNKKIKPITPPSQDEIHY